MPSRTTYGDDPLVTARDVPAAKRKRDHLENVAHEAGRNVRLTIGRVAKAASDDTEPWGVFYDAEDQGLD